MFHSRIETPPEHADFAFHPQFCGCTDCSINHDPIGHRARRRIVKLQAAVLLAFAFAIYATAAAVAPSIAASFGLGR